MAMPDGYQIVDSLGATARSKSRHVLLVVISVALLLSGISAEVRAEQSATEDITPESLIFMEVPMVVTAARKEQPVTEAPAAVTVVSAEEIRQSGALSIPDVLRMVSGVDVMTFSVRDQQVGIRGFNGPLTNKLLVLIDGRSVYNDFLGNVYWSLFPIAMEEIARIEVIKSPISTLYGANAFSGVINIITKTPQELNGTQVGLTGGSLDTAIGSVIQAGKGEHFHYKLSAGFDRTDEWEENTKAGDIARGNFYLGYDIGPEQTVALSAGRAHFEDLKVFVFESFGAIQEKGDYDYLQADYRHGRLKVRALRKSEYLDQIIERSVQPNEWTVVTYDTEAQYAFDAGEKHAVVIGADYRHIMLEENNYIGADQSQNLWALFGEDEFRLSNKIRLIAGGRYDRHPLVGGHFSSRGTVLYAPAPDQTVRFSVAQAFRNPTLLESYLQSATPTPPFTLIGAGNPDLKPEGVTSYEVGYRTTLTQRVTVGLNLFYNEYSDLIINTRVFAPPDIILSFANGMDARGVGGEPDLDILVTGWLSLFANYSYQQITDKDDNPGTVSVNEKDRVRRDTPRHKVNVGTRMRFNGGWSASLFAHWVDDTERLITDLAGNEYLAAVNSYTLVNGRVGYAFRKERAEASLSIFNIFNDRHYEYPPGINLPDHSSDAIGRKVTFTLGWKF
jgi:iron complex outermembrane receptor protein